MKPSLTERWAGLAMLGEPATCSASVATIQLMQRDIGFYEVLPTFLAEAKTATSNVQMLSKAGSSIHQKHKWQMEIYRLVVLGTGINGD